MRDPETHSDIKTVYLASDVARQIGFTPAWVRVETAKGRLRVSGISPRGVHVYSAADVQQYLQDRAARRRPERRADKPSE